MTDADGIGGGIGQTLREARSRLGLEIKEVEEQTKIRARYLRALEAEDWETLPAPVYVRGFLRTYGRRLGLDGEMLADEYRRRHEQEPAPTGPAASEPVLTGRSRGGERPPSRGPLIVAVGAAIVVLLLVLGLFGGDDEPDGNGGARQERSADRGGKQQKRKQKAEAKAEKQAKPEPKRPENAVLTALTAVEVCLVAGGDSALIDSQTLQAGSIESFSGVKNYRLDLGPGTVRFVVGKRKQRIEATDPVSFEGDSRGIRQISYQGPECP